MPQRIIARLPNVSNKQSLIGLETRIVGGKKQNNGTFETQIQRVTYLLMTTRAESPNLFMSCSKHVI